MSIYRRRLMIANALKKSDSNINYPNLIAAWSAAGKSNNDADRDVLRDLTGNGHDITLNGFAFNTEGSGYGHPSYPDALVFDGVDDYGVNGDMPILTDYTIIAKRELFEISGTKDKGFISYAKSMSDERVSNLFGLETYYNNWFWAVSFGSQTLISSKVNINKDIVYQTKSSYNGFVINNGNIEDTSPFKTIRFGRIYNNYMPLAFYSAYLFDRSLDEQEIKAFIRKYIDADYVLPSEQTTE